MKKKIKFKDLLELNNKLDLMLRTSLDLKRNTLFKSLLNKTEVSSIIQKFNNKELKKIKEQLNIDIEKPLKKEIHRKIYHLSSLWIPLSIYFLPYFWSLAIFSVLLLGDICFEYGNYKKWNWSRKTFGYIFARVCRREEGNRKGFHISGSAYVFLSAVLSLLLFSKPIAIIGMSVMIISDTCAALIGRALGSRKIYKNKSVEGTFAFFVSALIVNMCLNPIYTFTYVNVLACMVAAIAEIYGKSFKLDDNLSIPMSIGIVLTLLG